MSAVDPNAKNIQPFLMNPDNRSHKVKSANKADDVQIVGSISPTKAKELRNFINEHNELINKIGELLPSSIKNEDLKNLISYRLNTLQSTTEMTNEKQEAIEKLEAMMTKIDEWRHPKKEALENKSNQPNYRDPLLNTSIQTIVHKKINAQTNNLTPQTNNLTPQKNNINAQTNNINAQNNINAVSQNVENMDPYQAGIEYLKVAKDSKSSEDIAKNLAKAYLSFDKAYRHSPNDMKIYQEVENIRKLIKGDLGKKLSPGHLEKLDIIVNYVNPSNKQDVARYNIKTVPIPSNWSGTLPEDKDKIYFVNAFLKELEGDDAAALALYEKSRSGAFPPANYAMGLHYVKVDGKISSRAEIYFSNAARAGYENAKLKIKEAEKNRDLEVMEISQKLDKMLNKTGKETQLLLQTVSKMSNKEVKEGAQFMFEILSDLHLLAMKGNDKASEKIAQIIKDLEPDKELGKRLGREYSFKLKHAFATDKTENPYLNGREHFRNAVELELKGANPKEIQAEYNNAQLSYYKPAAEVITKKMYPF
jgi:TPR repeat protein